MNTRTRQIQRTVEITLERFARLPFLIPRGVVEEWTGLTSEDVSRLVESGQLRVWRSHARAKAKFYRMDVAAILRLNDRTRASTTGNAPKPE